MMPPFDFYAAEFISDYAFFRSFFAISFAAAPFSSPIDAFFLHAFADYFFCFFAACLSLLMPLRYAAICRVYVLI